MKKEDVGFARNLIKSINCGLDKLEKGSQVEEDYLHEKITKLHDLIVGDEDYPKIKLIPKEDLGGERNE